MGTRMTRQVDDGGGDGVDGDDADVDGAADDDHHHDDDADDHGEYDHNDGDDYKDDDVMMRHIRLMITMVVMMRTRRMMHQDNDAFGAWCWTREAVPPEQGVCLAPGLGHGWYVNNKAPKTEKDPIYTPEN